MNLILFSADELTGDKHLTLTDQRFQHIRNIHRAKAGDCIRVGQINGLMGTGTLQEINDKHAILKVELNQQPAAKLPLTLVLALPRPKMVRRIIRSVAELGVSELMIINSYKVEKSYWQSPLLHEDKINRYLLDGLQQAKDTHLPAVSLHRLFKPFVEDELPTRSAGTEKLVAHPGIGRACPQPLDKPTTLVIGPEGGFTEYEVNKLLEAGFEAIHLGPRILRVENALTTLVSKLYSCV